MGSFPEERNFSRRDFLKLGGAGLAVPSSAAPASPAYVAAPHSGQASSGSSSITRQDWGSVDDKPVSLYTLSNGRQMTGGSSEISSTYSA